MRLSKIKLAGFKSFVEPTTILFPENLTGIIGPNGCGKSNVIDAVRWVMGESSAKQLRGDSMEDVIFNGSSSRPAVSKASVELIFDNSEGKLGGQYAQYNEIQIRREASRDGGSSYFLNGTRCRRRDIADLFLGTGLGPRSYAIIEQGMISRVIEAKPEELRVYLEEAAGISKYKERRRETENRIKHTRENLDRLNDLREEIEKQLNHLKRQANAAERYKVFKEEERTLKAELTALKWQELSQSLEEKQKDLTAQQTKVEALLAEQRAVETNIEKQRQEQTASNDALNQVQGRFYKIGSEISRIEQSIQHHKDTTKRHQQDLEQINSAWQAATQHIEEDKSKLENLEKNMQHQEPDFDALQETEKRSTERLYEAERNMLNWQNEWDAFNQEYAGTNQTVEVESTRSQQLHEQIERLGARRERVNHELEKISTEAIESQMETAASADAHAQRQQEEAKERLESGNQDILQLRGTITRQSEELDQANNKMLDVRGQLTALEAMQQAALGKKDENTVAWLEKQGLSKNTRLAEELTVEDGWERAIETVLGSTLEAICVDKVESILPGLGALEHGSLNFLEKSATTSANKSAEWLLSKVKSTQGLDEFLQGVRVAESIDEALSLRSRLGDNESIVTKEGVWLGRNWLRVSHAAKDQGSVLAREQEISSLQETQKKLNVQIQEIESQLEKSKIALSTHENERDALQERLQVATSDYATAHAEINNLKNQLEQTRQRRVELESESKELNAQIDKDQAQLGESKTRSNSASQSKSQLDAKRQQLTDQKEQLTEVLNEAKQRAAADKQAVHEIMVNLESMRTEQKSTDQSLTRMQQQLSHLQKRREELQSILEKGDSPVIAMESELKELLNTRLGIEKELGEARTQVEVIEKSIRELDLQRGNLEKNVQELRSALEEARLAAQETRVRCQTLKEQLDESGFQIETLIENMSEEANVKDWSQRLETLTQKIHRMGPINLAAIDEHKEQSERKEYLDAQHKDLTDALTTLEDAIAKIDKETRSRFKEIFEQVNTHIKDMFPRLFGGGQAYLEMTGDDLLSTGIAIMAKPPGKRISNIHLLSGGEKALTAVAMVFAIFQLNPAPFCMLDEVDAPLDEANVGRFSALVKEMSARVQFIMITHNKSSMETVEQLTGVTMREAGVSRIVAVDIGEAVKMAAA